MNAKISVFAMKQSYISYYIICMTELVKLMNHDINNLR